MGLLDEFKKYFALKGETLGKTEIVQLVGEATGVSPEKAPSFNLGAPATLKTYYGGPGTYTLNGVAEDYPDPMNVFFWDKNEWDVLGVPIDVPPAENKIENWVPGTYYGGSSPDQRIWKGQLWTVDVETTEEEPGNSSDWKPELDFASTSEVNREREARLNIQAKLNDYLVIDEDQICIVDKNGNVGFRFSKDGFDAVQLGENLTGIIVSLVEEGVSESVPTNLKVTEDTGFYLVDASGNVSFLVDKDGAFDVLKIGKNLSGLIQYNRLNIELVRQREELTALKTIADTSIDSLSSFNINPEPFERVVSIPNTTGNVLRNHMIRFGFHFGDQQGDDVFNEIFFNGNCKKNFGDIRFLDIDDSLLPHKIVGTGNYDIVQSTGLFETTKVVFQLSDGRILKSFDNDISSDYGQTWGPTPINGVLFFVDPDNNVYTSIDGTVIKWYYATDYATSKQVIDLRFEHEGQIVSGGINGPNAACIDNLGYLYFGQYQEEWHVALWRSKDGGEAFENCYPYDVGQHVHHVHYNPYDNGIYLGIDDSVSEAGPIATRSLDHGDTWGTVAIPYRNRDYCFNYFGDGFTVGGGEGDILGGAGIYRTEDMVNYENCVPPALGIRTIVSMDGTDDDLICGVLASGSSKFAQIIRTRDKARTWETIWSYPSFGVSNSGSGVRYFQKVVEAGGEEYFVCSGYANHIPTVKIYNGGDRYYAEAYCIIPEIPIGGKQIKIRSGYAMDAPGKVLDYSPKPVYHIPFNEGFGDFINDSMGRSIFLDAAKEWEKADTVRLGELLPYTHGYGRNYGLSIQKAVNLGKVPVLNFNKGFTVSFWTNQKFGLEQAGLYGKRIWFFSIGQLRFFQQNRGIGVAFGNNQYRPFAVPVHLLNTDSYVMITITVSDAANPSITSYINQIPNESSSVAAVWPAENLSEGDMVLGIEHPNDTDIHNPYPISDLRIYNKALTAKEVAEKYFGFNL